MTDKNVRIVFRSFLIRFKKQVPGAIIMIYAMFDQSLTREKLLCFTMKANSDFCN